MKLKCVRRLYRLDGLQVRLPVRKRRHRSLHRGPVAPATGARQRCSIDFVHDRLVDGRASRVLSVVDQWSSQSPLLEVVQRVTRADVAAALERVRQEENAPRSITVDRGTEFTSRALDMWAFEHRNTLDFTRPGKPTDNAQIESFNARLRDECLNVHQFHSLAHAKGIIEAWRVDHNEHCPMAPWAT